MEELYQNIVNYFGNIQLQYYRENNGVHVYACALKTGLLINYRYIMVTVDTYTGEYINLGEVDWTSFQTRTLEEELPVLSQEVNTPYYARQNLDVYLNVVGKNDKYYEYVTIFPVKIRLLRTVWRWGDNPPVYPDQTKMNQAIETYNCVIFKI